MRRRVRRGRRTELPSGRYGTVASVPMRFGPGLRGRCFGIRAAIGLLLLTGCRASGAGGDGAGADGAPVQEGASSAPYEGGVHYVALGDSFSAGPLIPEARNDASGCFVSTNNYPAYLADLLDVASYTDATCSGATTQDFRRRQPVPGSLRPAPQLKALSEETDLVTVGIGGNDFGLFGSALACAGHSPTCDPRLRGDALATAKRIAQPVTRALRAVRTRAPEAEVYVVGYLRLLPDKGTCPDAGISADDVATANRIQEALNGSLARAAASVGVTYVDLGPASTGHDVCAGGDAWVNGMHDRPGEAMSWHPFRSGMAAVAAVAYEQITGAPAPEITGAAMPDDDAVVRRG